MLCAAVTKSPATAATIGVCKSVCPFLVRVSRIAPTCPYILYAKRENHGGLSNTGQRLTGPGKPFTDLPSAREKGMLLWQISLGCFDSSWIIICLSVSAHPLALPLISMRSILVSQGLTDGEY